MKKSHKIIYWVATLWLSLGMVSTGIVQILQTPEEAAKFSQLGYPSYLMTLLGVLKFLGVIALLVPKFPLVKEWAYAGFFFAMLGAAVSHIAAGNPSAELFGPILLLVLTAISWYYRPAERKTLQVA